MAKCPSGYRENAKGKCVGQSVLKEDERLSGTPYTDYAEAPSRRGVMRLATPEPPPIGRGGVVGAALSAGGAVMEELGRQAGLPIDRAVADHIAQKEKSLADTRARADAARAASVQGTGELNTPRERTPAPSSDATQPKRGTAPGAIQPTTNDPHYANTVPVKMPDGRVIWADPATARTLGGQGMDRGEAIAASGSREDSNQRYRGADVARGQEGSAYLRPSTRVKLPPKVSERRPYSEQVRELIATMPAADLADPGTNWSFTGGREAGNGTPREGTRRLSGLEQAMSRREWLEGRSRQERDVELEDAMAAHRLRASQVDPLEAARIEAQGRYGGRTAEVALDLRSREAALAEYDSISVKMEQAREALAIASPGSPQEARLKEFIDLLERERRERANLILGQRITDPRTDQFGAFFSGLTSPVGAAGTPAPGAS